LEAVLRTFLHLVGASIWVGSQVFILAVGVPMLRTLDDRAARLRLVKTMTRNFGWLGGAALVIQVATGLWLFYTQTPGNYRDLRYGFVFDFKMTLVTLTILLTAFHTFVLGPRMLRIMGDGTAALSAEDEANLRTLRKRSGIVSALNLLIAVLILVAAAAMVSPWSHEAR